MLLGSFFKRVGLIDEAFSAKMNKFAFAVALPALLFQDISAVDIREPTKQSFLPEMSSRFLPASRRNGFRPTISLHWLHTKKNADCWNKLFKNNNGSFSATTPIHKPPVSKRQKADCICQSGKAYKKPLSKSRKTDILTKIASSGREKKKDSVHFSPYFGLFLENSDQNKTKKPWFYPFLCLDLKQNPTTFHQKPSRERTKSRRVSQKTRREIPKRFYFCRKWS